MLIAEKALVADLSPFADLASTDQTEATQKDGAEYLGFLPNEQNSPITETNYEVRFASSRAEVEEALRLRWEVFRKELNGESEEASGNCLDCDEFDRFCLHLIVREKKSGRVVGTYRLNTAETAGSLSGFYSYSEFSLEDLPIEILANGVEVGRASIAAEHRSSRVLHLLWKALAMFLANSNKRYVFGCCSIFSRNPVIGEAAFNKLAAEGKFHPKIRIEPKKSALYLTRRAIAEEGKMQLPTLFELYLRLGAKVCGPPMFDEDFGSIDFFVIFDREEMPQRYRKLYFDSFIKSAV